MKVFDYLNLANPRYFKDNRMEAHSDHRYYKNEQELKGYSSFYFSFRLKNFFLPFLQPSMSHLSHDRQALLIL